MAPIGEAYFPPLDRCLNGAQLLWSWELCFNVLSRPEDNQNDPIQRFLSDEHAKDLLIRSLSPYSSGTAETKSLFETKTSAINAASPSHAPYNIQEIKEDALWLSRGARIDEVNALRIVILEYQSRAATELSRLEEQAAHTALGSATLVTSNGQTSPRQLESNQAMDATSAQRRKRLVEILLSERRYILKCSQYIAACHLYDDEQNSITLSQSDEQLKWLYDLGETLIANWTTDDSTGAEQPRSQSSFISDAIQAAGTRVEGSIPGDLRASTASEQEQEQLNFLWSTSELIETVHILEITLDMLQSRHPYVPADTVLQWFRLMAQVGFFESLQLPDAGFGSGCGLALQSLASLISLNLIDLEETCMHLSRASSLVASPDITTNPPYIYNLMAVKELNGILIDAAPSAGASLCVMAWAILSQTMRNLSLATRDARETRQEMRALDTYAGDSSDTDHERPHKRNLTALRRRSSTGSDSSNSTSLLEEIYEIIETSSNFTDEDSIQYLARTATENGKLFDVITSIAVQFCHQYRQEHEGLLDRVTRKALLSLLTACVQFIDYQPALISAIVAVIAGNGGYWDYADDPAPLHHVGPGAAFLQDHELRRATFDQALRRFPYESWPAFQLAKAVIPWDNSSGHRSEILRELYDFTCVLPVNYQGYHNIREDEALDFIELSQDYMIDLSFSAPSSAEQNLIGWRNGSVSRSAHFDFELPAGTQGQVLSDGKPLVVAWTFQYSGLAFIGRLLQHASNTNLRNQDPGSPLSSEIVAEAIDVIATLIIATVQHSRGLQGQSSPVEAATPILDEASDELGRNEDIVSVAFRLFEIELYKERKRGDEDENINVLRACVRFTHALLTIMPDRVWPFLGRSGLLAVNDDSGQLSAVVTAYEIPTGQYGFLYGCIRLYNSLIEDVMGSGVSRKRPLKALTRFDDSQGFGAGISAATMEKVLSNLQRVMTDVFESFYDWKFVDLDGRADIGFWICTTFNNLLNYSFGSETGSHSKVNDPLLPAAKDLLEGFVVDGKADLLLQTLLRICTEGTVRSSSSIPTLDDLRRMKQTTAALRLSSTLINAGTFMQHNMTRFQTQFFKSLGVFASLYAVAPECRIPVTALLNALIQSSFKSQRQPPSLLAHLGQTNSIRLLETLSTLDKPVNNAELKIETWHLLSSILAMRQEWFAHFILIGKQPGRRPSSETNGANVQKANPMLYIALDSLSNIDRLDLSQALAMLKFVAAAVDFWPQILQVINDHPKFMISISHHASSPPIRVGGRNLSTQQDLQELRILSLIVHILAMYTHWDQQEGQNKFSEEILRHLHALGASVAVTPSYNTSLHGNLRQNFAAKFPGCQLDDFRRSKLHWVDSDELPYYDIGLADKMLSFEPAWNGKGKLGRGFADEMSRANLNLSIVEAQTDLFHSWSTLLLELSDSLGKHSKFQKLIADNVVECLKANSDNSLPEAISQRLLPARADLAFALLETLNLSKSQEPEVQAILSVAWNTLCSHNNDLGAALSSPEANYHRLLIRILYLAVQIHTFHEPPPAPEPPASTNGSTLLNPKPIPTSPSINIALDIISTLISRGFRSLSSLLLDSPAQVTPADFHLLTALLNACLQTPNVTLHTTTLMSAFTTTSTPRCAASLLSWSDQLAPTTHGDPIYAEIAIHFLVELSTVDPIAESLAVDAVLSHILATNLMQVLQDRAFGPWDTPARMFTIWSRGLLPLLLNLLLAVGAPVAPEVAAALNLFPHQLERASAAFSTSPPPSSSSSTNHALGSKHPNPAQAGLLTLGLAQEAHCLALIVSILNKFRAAGPSAGIQPQDLPQIQCWDWERVREDVEGVLSRKGGVSERVVPVSEKEVGWARLPGRKIEGVESLLEEKVVGELRGVLGILRVGEGK